MKKPLLLALFSFVGSVGVASTVYEEIDGIVIMDAENTASPLGEWTRESSHPGFTGTGYIEFHGNQFTHGPAISPLEYRFRINQGGLYYLQLRVAETNQIINGEERDDVWNDCYVRVDGDYTASPEAGNNHMDDATLAVLQSDTKFFGGANDGSFKWEGGYKNDWQGHLDPGGHQNKRVAIYNFKAGETYTLVIHGRSKAFKIDRIAFASASLSDSAPRSLSLGETLPPRALADWRQLHFGTDQGVGNAADDVDANVDGESNLIEFATGQDPWAPTLGTPKVEVAGDTIEYRSTRSVDAESEGINFLVEYGSSLGSDSWSSSGITHQVESETDGEQTVLTRIPLADAPQKFVRMTISK